MSIVVPCFNEQGTLSVIAAKLEEFRAKFAARFETQFIFVDDGSTDKTHEELVQSFAGHDGVLIVRHGQNRGIAAAILTGISVAEHEYVVSLDSDCSYDPLLADRLIDALEQEQQAVMATASPYHPSGNVIGVPQWRLWLSRQASARYRRATFLKLHTFTSCFRAYRRSSFLGMELEDGGYVGIAEMLWLASRRGPIVEVPAELATRKLGFSKLRTIPVIRRHLSLLRRIRRTPNAMLANEASTRTT
jgi:dolichol-phosphate mannosyltransferase